jgi:hypothetical protein
LSAALIERGGFRIIAWRRIGRMPLPVATEAGLPDTFPFGL